MKKTAAIFFILIGLSAKADFWTQKANLPADTRGAAAGFSIGTKGYIGTGINFSAATQFHNDFWEFDPPSNSWTQKANFGGTGRSGAVGFSLLGKGYIACGYDANTVRTDVWAYDPLANTWSQKANIPGPGRDYTVAFTIDSFAYLGTGYNSNNTNYNDCYKYNPVINTWSTLPNVGAQVRSSAMAFVANGYGYIAGGYGAGPLNDCWKYNPVSNSWAQVANLPSGSRSDGNAFDLNGKGFIIAGYLNGNTVNDLWQYNDQSNTWSSKTALTGSSRSDAVSFSIGNKAYIGTGYDPGFNSLNDLWEYTPDTSSSTGVIQENTNEFLFQLYADQDGQLIIARPGEESIQAAELYIFDMNGKTVYNSNLKFYKSNQVIININHFSKGIYLVTLNLAGQKFVKRILKQ